VSDDQAGLSDQDPFHVPDPAVITVEADTPGRRRTLRQRALIAGGVHPLTGRSRPVLKLHPEEGRRCGNCRFRELALHYDYRYPKCFWTGSLGPEELHKHGHPRVTHGEATDVRAWWPACTDHEYGDPQLSSDAFRSGPLPPTPPVV
jgi:hypothetical protein